MRILIHKKINPYRTYGILQQCFGSVYVVYGSVSRFFVQYGTESRLVSNTDPDPGQEELKKKNSQPKK